MKCENECFKLMKGRDSLLARQSSPEPIVFFYFYRDQQIYQFSYREALPSLDPKPPKYPYLSPLESSL